MSALRSERERRRPLRHRDLSRRALAPARLATSPDRVAPMRPAGLRPALKDFPGGAWLAVGVGHAGMEPDLRAWAESVGATFELQPLSKYGL